MVEKTFLVYTLPEHFIWSGVYYVGVCISNYTYVSEGLFRYPAVGGFSKCLELFRWLQTSFDAQINLYHLVATAILVKT